MSYNGTKTILIADDHPVVRVALRQLLSTCGVASIKEAGSLAALAQTIAETPDIGCVLLDLTMADSAGIGGLVYLRNLHPFLRIAVLHEDDNIASMRACLNLGARASIPKSAETTHIRDAVFQCLEGGIWAPAAVLSAMPAADASIGGLLSLTPQESRVLVEVLKGVSNASIAEHFGVAVNTIKRHVANVSHKLNVRSRIQLISAVRNLEGRPWRISLPETHSPSGTSALAKRSGAGSDRVLPRYSFERFPRTTSVPV